VLDACGRPHDIEDEEILERLLALNLERAAMSGSVTQASSASDVPSIDECAVIG